MRFDDGMSVVLTFHNGVRTSARWFFPNGSSITRRGDIIEAEKKHSEYLQYVPEAISVDNRPQINNNNSASINQSISERQIDYSSRSKIAQIEAEERKRREEFERKRPSELSIIATSIKETAPYPNSRSWHDRKGGCLNAKWIEIDLTSDTITLLADKDGRKIKAKLHKFSSEDEAYVRSEIKRFRREGFELLGGWWHKTSKVSGREIKNGGFTQP